MCLATRFGRRRRGVAGHPMVPRPHSCVTDLQAMKHPSTGPGSFVSVIDDDESVRESLPDLLRQFGYVAEAFSSAESFLASGVMDATSCLILDVAMPGMSGPDLQQELIRLQLHIPIVFITAGGDESVRANLIAQGAV